MKGLETKIKFIIHKILILKIMAYNLQKAYWSEFY